MMSICAVQGAAAVRAPAAATAGASAVCLAPAALQRRGLQRQHGGARVAGEWQRCERLPGMLVRDGVLPMGFRVAT